MNRLPEKWYIKCTKENIILFRNNVIKYLDEIYNRSFVGVLDKYYGCSENTIICHSRESDYIGYKQLTIEEFIELSKSIDI